MDLPVGTYPHEVEETVGEFMKKLLIIIPAYNEEKSIEKVVEHIIHKYAQYDYVVVNDGSEDKTAEICYKNRFQILDLPVHLGLSGAFQTGIKYAYQRGYQYAVQFDGDGQHRAEFLADMLEKMEEGYDIAIGSRFVQKKKDFSLRMIGSRIITASIRIATKVKIADPTSGMRMFSKRMIEEFTKNINLDPEPDTISYLMKNGAKVVEVPVIMDERQVGTSYLSRMASVKYMIRMLVSILLLHNFRNRG